MTLSLFFIIPPPPAENTLRLLYADVLNKHANKFAYPFKLAGMVK
jgi:hypothetical protein